MFFLKLLRASYQTPQGSLYPSNEHPRYRYTKYIYTSYTYSSNRAVKVFGDYVVHPSFSEPSLLLPGCYKTHRDASRNSNLVNDDPRGTFWNCPWGELPEIMPLQFDRSKMIYSNDVKEKENRRTCNS